MRLYNIPEYVNATTEAIVAKIGEELEELKAELISSATSTKNYGRIG